MEGPTSTNWHGADLTQGYPHMSSSTKHSFIYLALTLVLLRYCPRWFRWWFVITIAVGFTALFTIESPHDYNNLDVTASTAQYAAADAKMASSLFGLGYHFPWYCVVYIVAWALLLTYGITKLWRAQTVMLREQAATGQLPMQRLGRWLDGLSQPQVVNQTLVVQQPPQGPTGPSGGPSGPPPAPRGPKPLPPAPPAPMGSGTPKLWVPTYSGPAKPVQRIETSPGGVVMHDHRRIDPEEL